MTPNPMPTPSVSVHDGSAKSLDLNTIRHPKDANYGLIEREYIRTDGYSRARSVLGTLLSNATTRNGYGNLSKDGQAIVATLDTFHDAAIQSISWKYHAQVSSIGDKTYDLSPTASANLSKADLWSAEATRIARDIDNDMNAFAVEVKKIGDQSVKYTSRDSQARLINDVLEGTVRLGLGREISQGVKDGLDQIEFSQGWTRFGKDLITAGASAFMSQYVTGSRVPGLVAYLACNQDEGRGLFSSMKSLDETVRRLSSDQQTAPVVFNHDNIIQSLCEPEHTEKEEKDISWTTRVKTIAGAATNAALSSCIAAWYGYNPSAGYALSEAWGSIRGRPEHSLARSLIEHTGPLAKEAWGGITRYFSSTGSGESSLMSVDSGGKTPSGATTVVSDPQSSDGGSQTSSSS